MRVKRTTMPVLNGELQRLVTMVTAVKVVGGSRRNFIRIAGANGLNGIKFGAHGKFMYRREDVLRLRDKLYGGIQ